MNACDEKVDAICMFQCFRTRLIFAEQIRRSYVAALPTQLTSDKVNPENSPIRCNR